jgi:hypothetical protein
MATLQVAHDIPGRLRVRVPTGVDVEDALASLTAEPGMLTCRWSPRTRSLLVVYDPDGATRERVHETVAQRLGMVTPTVGVTAATHAAGRVASFAAGVRQLFGEADAGVHRATRGLLGLGGLLPAALTAWALTEIVRGRAAPLAWSTALWYAHGLFRDYQLPVSED